MARGRLSGRHRHHQAPAGALDTTPRSSRRRRFFFCQLEAIETLIWLAEAPAAERVGIEVPGDGGAFQRLCAKMATGSGKTIVMAMLIAWHVLNKVTYPQDTRFSKNVLVVAPGLTVRSRLAVLEPVAPGQLLRRVQHRARRPCSTSCARARCIVRNWHALNWETRRADRQEAQRRQARREERRGLCPRRARRDGQRSQHPRHQRRGAPRLARAGRVEGQGRLEGRDRGGDEVGRRPRPHPPGARHPHLLTTSPRRPFAPSGKKSSEEALFGWIVSDFGLNDAIESGLVKTPRVVVRDDGMPDARTYKSRLYHIYNDPEVKDDLNRKARAARAAARPGDRTATTCSATTGSRPRKAWKDGGLPTPPVMITVANRTETAARIKYAFDHEQDPHRRTVRPGADAAHRLEGAGEAEAARGSRSAAPVGRRRGRRRRATTSPKRKLTKKSRPSCCARRSIPSASRASRASRSRT